MTRTPLPNRRSHETLDFEHWGRRFSAGIGRATESSPIHEIWLNTGKTGEQMETLARDAAVLLSLALQYGTPLSAMRHACMRDLDGKASGPIGKLLDLLAGDEDDRASAAVLPVVSGEGADGAEPANA